MLYIGFINFFVVFNNTCNIFFINGYTDDGNLFMGQNQGTDQRPITHQLYAYSIWL